MKSDEERMLESLQQYAPLRHHVSLLQTQQWVDTCEYTETDRLADRCRLPLCVWQLPVSAALSQHSSLLVFCVLPATPVIVFANITFAPISTQKKKKNKWSKKKKPFQNFLCRWLWGNRSQMVLSWQKNKQIKAKKKKTLQVRTCFWII